MSLKSYRRAGHQQWHWWTYGSKHPIHAPERQHGRAEVRALKRLAHRYDRREAKRLIQQEPR